MTASKRAARTAATLARDAAFAAPDSAGQMAAANEHLERYVLTQFADANAPPVLAGYIAMRSESDPFPVMARHAGPVCVPVVAGPGQALEFHRWRPGCDMRAGTYGVMIPAQSAPLVPQVLIVPGLAFDAHGYRLGYGGGFYDRTLAWLRAQGRIVAVGFAYAAQKVDAVPREATDAPLDALVTENGVQVFAST